MQVDEEILSPVCFIFGVVTAFEGDASPIFDLKIKSCDRFAFDEDIFRSEVVLFVEWS